MHWTLDWWVMGMRTIIHRKLSRFLMTACLPIAVAIFLNSCANSSIAPIIEESSPFLSHRWQALGATIFLGIIQIGLLPSSFTSDNSASLRTVAGGFLTWPLGHSKIGEWYYYLAKWVFDLWTPLLQGYGVLIGFSGNASAIIFNISIFGFALNNVELFYAVVPASIIGLLLNIVLLGALAFISSSNKNGGE
ncbi:hypothetical protein H6G51_07815 [Limnothrix sp. FACHB-708]|uniref:hypothetical protein n=1 Tax=unclassified Limnothrix TaxID=2632864 RepID=UPI001689A090|nr:MULTISPECIES: hypothetical protein [unclassified Limnothrix]MBD2553182.1 hypothetical protein [Limnothrix sp. FACHB-708]MBD2590794.1 hypothetical protein [Limnothrix sp. FACHB-406]